MAHDNNEKCNVHGMIAKSHSAFALVSRFLVFPEIVDVFLREARFYQRQQHAVNFVFVGRLHVQPVHAVMRQNAQIGKLEEPSASAFQLSLRQFTADLRRKVRLRRIHLAVLTLQLVLGRVDEPLHELGRQALGGRELVVHHRRDHHLQPRVVQILKSGHARAHRELHHELEQFRLENDRVLRHGHHRGDEQGLLDEAAGPVERRHAEDQADRVQRIADSLAHPHDQRDAPHDRRQQEAEQDRDDDPPEVNQDPGRRHRRDERADPVLADRDGVLVLRAVPALVHEPLGIVPHVVLPRVARVHHRTVHGVRQRAHEQLGQTAYRAVFQSAVRTHLLERHPERTAVQVPRLVRVPIGIALVRGHPRVLAAESVEAVHSHENRLRVRGVKGHLQDNDVEELPTPQILELAPSVQRTARADYQQELRHVLGMGYRVHVLQDGVQFRAVDIVLRRVNVNQQGAGGSQITRREAESYRSSGDEDLRRPRRRHVPGDDVEQTLRPVVDIVSLYPNNYVLPTDRP